MKRRKPQADRAALSPVGSRSYAQLWRNVTMNHVFRVCSRRLLISLQKDQSIKFKIVVIMLLVLNNIDCIFQDVKDIVLFCAPKPLITRDIINVLHMRVMDRFLRALIFYCQYYLQVFFIFK